jgi:hypothetical protein
MPNTNTILSLKNMVFVCNDVERTISMAPGLSSERLRKTIKATFGLSQSSQPAQENTQVDEYGVRIRPFLTVYMPYTVMEIYDCNTASCKSSDFSVYDHLRPCLLHLGINTNIILGGIETAYLLSDPDTNPKQRVFISEDQ